MDGPKARCQLRGGHGERIDWFYVSPGWNHCGLERGGRSHRCGSQRHPPYCVQNGTAIQGASWMWWMLHHQWMGETVVASCHPPYCEKNSKVLYTCRPEKGWPFEIRASLGRPTKWTPIIRAIEPKCEPEDRPSPLNCGDGREAGLPSRIAEIRFLAKGGIHIRRWVNIACTVQFKPAVNKRLEGHLGDDYSGTTCVHHGGQCSSIVLEEALEWASSNIIEGLVRLETRTVLTHKSSAVWVR
jgi:hypothetical protein